jgi:hypothetical protein
MAGSSDLSLSNKSFATNRTLLSVGKTSLCTSGSLTCYSLFGVSVGSDFESLGMSTYGTSKLLFTCFGTGSFLSYLGSAESVLGALRNLGNVVRIGLAALTLTFYEVMCMRCNIVRIRFTTLTLAINIAVSMFFTRLAGNLVDKIAGCKAAYHCNYKNKTSQKS